MILSQLNLRFHKKLIDALKGLCRIKAASGNMLFFCNVADSYS